MLSLSPAAIQDYKKDADGINGYLYQVLPNSSYQAEPLPVRDSRGQLINRPILAVNLSYIISFFGDEETFVPQRLLGSTMTALNSAPLLDKHVIQAIEDNYAYLAKSRLDRQAEQIKVTLVPMNLEELHRLWSLFGQAPYQLSLAYQVSLLLLESDEQPMPKFPVQKVQVVSNFSFQPVIETHTPRTCFYDSVMTLHGKNFRKGMTVRWRNLDLETSIDSSQKISFRLPSNVVAGTHLIQVVEENSGLQSSDPYPILISPTIIKTEKNEPMAWLEKRQDGESVSGKIVIEISPSVMPSQHVEIILTPFEPQGAALQVSATPIDTRSTKVSFNISSILPGKYGVRVVVDRIQSPLDYDPSVGYVGPFIHFEAS